MSECNVNDLLSAGRDFNSLTDQQLLAVQAQLLCDIANGAGGGITGFTPGSVVFIGADGAGTEDNPNFFYDDTNNRLRVGSRTEDISILATYKPKINATYATSAADSGIILGLVGQTVIKHSVTGTAHGVTGVVELNDAAATVTSGLLGFNGVVLLRAGTANGTTAGGALNAAILAGTAGNVYGATLTASINTGGTINNSLHGVLVNPIIVAGTVTQDVIGMRIAVQAIGGTVSRDLYLCHIASSSTGTTITGTKWGIYLDTGGQAAMVGISVKASAAHSGNLLQFMDSSSVVGTRFDSTESLIMKAASSIQLGNAAVAETPAATHTLQVKDSSGTVYKLLCTT